MIALRVWPFLHLSEAWGSPQFQETRSRSEKAILGALGEFRGILGAALGVQKIIHGMRNSNLGMGTFRSNSRSDSRNWWEHTKDFHLPMHSRSGFSKIGAAPTRQNLFHRLIFFGAYHHHRYHCQSNSP